MIVIFWVVIGMLSTMLACWLVMKWDSRDKSRSIFNKAKVKYFDGDNT